MTSLTRKEVEERWSVTKSEVDEYIKRNRLRLPPVGTKHYKAFQNRIRRKLRAVKISETVGSKESFAYEIGPWQIIYGQVKAGSLISFIATLNNRRNLDMVYTLAAHEIVAVDEMWIDNEVVLFGGSPDPRWSLSIYNPDDNRTRSAVDKVFMAVNNGNPANPAIADLVARHPAKWTADHKQTNRAHAFVILVWDPVIFPNGVPAVSFVVRGKPIYDFHTATVTSVKIDNAARVIADYLMNTTYGMSCALADLETTPGVPGSFYDAQTICAEQVLKRDGTPEDRYTINGAFTGEDTPENIIEKMLTACAGTLTYVGGKWKLFPAAWLEPRLVLDEGDCLDEILIRTKISRRDSFNGVKGTFISKMKDYLEDDFPPVKNDYYQSLDNGERVWEDIQLPYTTSDATAQRIAKIFLEQTRQQITIDGTFDIKAYQAEIGVPVCVVNERMGWGDPRENMLLWSEDLTKSVWTKYSCTIDSVATDTPYGEARPAMRINETTATATHAAAQTFTVLNGLQYNFKWTLKADGRTFARCYVENSSGTPFAAPELAIVVNLSTGAIVSSVGGSFYKVRSLGSGWYEVEGRKTATAAGTGLISVHTGLDGTTFGHTGTVGQGVLTAGIQVKGHGEINVYTQTKDAQRIATGAGKFFMPEQIEPVLDNDENGVPRFGVQMALKETARGVFDWNNGEETGYDLSGNTDLPSAFDVPALTGMGLFSGTAELYITSDGTVVSRIRVAWTEATDGFTSGGGSIEIQWKPTAGAVWSAPILVPGNFSYYWILDVQDGVAYDVRIRAKNALNVFSDYTTVTGHVVVGKTAPPSNVSGLASNVTEYGVVLGWSAIGDLDVDYYELKSGSLTDLWADMQVLAEVSGTTFQTNLLPAGDYKFAIKAVDTSGNRSTAEAITTLTVGGPPAPTLTATIVGSQARLEWNAVSGQFQVLDYILRYGATFAGGTQIGATQSTVHIEEVRWGGERTFWIAARDVAGNIGAASSATATITVPTVPQSVTVQVIDNNVLLRWLAPATSTLPIDFYKIFKGDTFIGATQIGQVSATFSNIVELVGGTFTYWLQAFDTAGNAGAEIGVVAAVSQPPDYILRDQRNQNATNETSSSGTVQDGEVIFGGIDSTITWDNHFTTNSWTTINDQIAAGYPYYLQPNTVSSSIEWDDIDFGAVIPATIVTATMDVLEVEGDSTFTIELRHSTDGVSYTLVDGAALSEYSKRWLVPSFRYLRLNIAVTPGASNHGLYELSNTDLRLDVKQVSDSGGPITSAAAPLTQVSTISIATPAVVTFTAHGLVDGQQVDITTTGALPTGLATGTIYFVRNKTANTYNLSAEPQGALINTTGTQSGTHTVHRRGVAVFFNRTFIDVEGLTVTPTPTLSQRTANLPFTEVVSFKDSPYNPSFNVEIYDGAGSRVDCDFRWSCRGI